MYELYYWDGLQGRGEFVRLALEAAGAPYRDVTREGDDGEAAMQAMLDDGAPVPPFAPPFFKDGVLVISHVANILAYLGPRHDLVPDGEAGRATALGLQLTITDLVAEIHDTHHPIDTGAYYEEQIEPAKARAAAFLSARMPKFLGYFERVLQRNPAGSAHMLGTASSYVDLSLFQVIAGLRYAFPRATADFAHRYPALAALHDRVAVLPRIAAYLASPRRIAFNESGIFRRYAELDRDP